jgi:iron-sulfur cluster repair protein YtfE (RIC family)
MSTTTTPITPDTLVNEAVRSFPATLPLFAALGIDTCCGGAKPVEEAARRHGADPVALLARLNEVARGGA